jgi:hypothetical protein
VSPAAVYLAHKCVPAQRRAARGRRGQVLRLALIESQGISSDDLTPELIAENIDKVPATTDAQVMTVGALTPTGDRCLRSGIVW